MNWFDSADKWVESRVKGLLEWLEEWLSITQKAAEKSLIVIYVLMLFLKHFMLHMHYVGWAGVLMAGGMVASLMYIQHRRPEAMRQYGTRLRPIRVMITAFVFIAPSVLEIFLMTRFGICDMIQSAAYVTFWYSTSIHSGGQRGRKRKLAMEELKKLFGELTWIPKPAMIPE